MRWLGITEPAQVHLPPQPRQMRNRLPQESGELVQLHLLMQTLCGLSLFADPQPLACHFHRAPLAGVEPDGALFRGEQRSDRAQTAFDL